MRETPISQARMWMQFYSRYPFNPEAMHQLPSAALAALYANSHMKEGAKRVTVKDMLPIGFTDPNGAQEEDEGGLFLDDNW